MKLKFVGDTHIGAKNGKGIDDYKKKTVPTLLVTGLHKGYSGNTIGDILPIFW